MTVGAMRFVSTELPEDVRQHVHEITAETEVARAEKVLEYLTEYKKNTKTGLHKNPELTYRILKAEEDIVENSSESFPELKQKFGRFYRKAMFRLSVLKRQARGNVKNTIVAYSTRLSSIYKAMRKSENETTFEQNLLANLPKKIVNMFSLKGETAKEQRVELYQRAQADENTKQKLASVFSLISDEPEVSLGYVPVERCEVKMEDPAGFLHISISWKMGSTSHTETFEL